MATKKKKPLKTHVVKFYGIRDKSGYDSGAFGLYYFDKPSLTRALKDRTLDRPRIYTESVKV
jgi:hypothetical protein